MAYIRLSLIAKRDIEPLFPIAVLSGLTSIFSQAAKNIMATRKNNFFMGLIVTSKVSFYLTTAIAFFRASSPVLRDPSSPKRGLLPGCNSQLRTLNSQLLIKRRLTLRIVKTCFLPTRYPAFCFVDTFKVSGIVQRIHFRWMEDIHRALDQSN